MNTYSTGVVDKKNAYSACVLQRRRHSCRDQYNRCINRIENGRRYRCIEHSHTVKHKILFFFYGVSYEDPSMKKYMCVLICSLYRSSGLLYYPFILHLFCVSRSPVVKQCFEECLNDTFRALARKKTRVRNMCLTASTT